MKLFTGLVPSKGSEGKCVPVLSTSSLWYSLGSAASGSLPLSSDDILYVCMCVCVLCPKFLSSGQGTSHIGLGTTLLHYYLILTNNICMTLFPNKVEFLGSGG